MPARKTSVTTPLHLLQQLSSSLVEHLQKACSEAQQDAEMLLAKLEKQRGRTQEKIIKARAKLDESGNAGKAKAQAKARSRLTELDDMLAVLQSRQSETLTYLSELKRDAEQSLQLAQGVTKVEQAAAQALTARSKPASTRATSAKKTSVNSAKPAASIAQTAGVADKVADGELPVLAASSAAVRARPAAKSGSRAQANNPAVTTAKPSTALKNNDLGAAVAAAFEEPPVAKKKATPRKPAAAKRPTTTQSPPTAN